MSVFRDLLQNFSVCTCSQEMLEDILTYRTKWTDFTFRDSAMEYEISSDGTLLRIYKVSPNFSVAWSNLENPSNVTLAEKFANWRIHISGVQEKRGNIFTYRTHGTWGGPNYSGRGLVFSPSNQGGNSLYILNYPWDLNVTNGSLKNPNDGWSSYGYTVDGQQNVFNITSFPERATIGTKYQMTMEFMTGTYGVGFAGNWGLNNTAYGTQYNNYKFGITRRNALTEVGAIWHTGTNDAFQIQVDGLKSGDKLVYKEETTFAVLASFDSDGIYTIPAYSGSSITTIDVDGNPEETSEVTVRYIMDGLDENGMIDFSDSPIDLRVLPTNDVIPLWRQECWECVDNRGVTHKKDMTVDNCLMKYYCGYEYSPTNVHRFVYSASNLTTNEDYLPYTVKVIKPTGECARLFKGFDRDSEPTYEFPPLDDVVDLDDYHAEDLAVECLNQASADEWADWLSDNDRIRPSTWYINLSTSGVSFHDYEISRYHLANSDEHPVVINIKREYDWQALNGTVNDEWNVRTHPNSSITNSLGSLVINYSATTGFISVMQDTFDTAYVKNLKFTVLNGASASTSYLAFCPQQFINTFAWQSGFDTIQADWFSYQRTTSTLYMFDWNNNIRQVLGSGSWSIGRNNGYGGANSYRWPCPVISGTTNQEPRIACYQTFNSNTNLEKVEPILDMYYVWDGSATEGLFHMFYNCPKLTYVRICRINCGDWDFTGENFNFPNIDADSIKYIFDNAEDQVSIKYDETYAPEDNTPITVTDGTRYDYRHIRSSKSVNGLNIYCPETWRDKITSEMIASINAKGWTVYIGGTVATA